jgi:hypothetical protein
MNSRTGSLVLDSEIGILVSLCRVLYDTMKNIENKNKLELESESESKYLRERVEYSIIYVHERSGPLKGPKKSQPPLEGKIFIVHPFNWAALWVSPPENNYIRQHLQNGYINSYYVSEAQFMVV